MTVITDMKEVKIPDPLLFKPAPGKSAKMVLFSLESPYCPVIITAESVINIDGWLCRNVRCFSCIFVLNTEN
jgi:hypothetical protein